MQIIYDIRNNLETTLAIQQQIKNGKSTYRTEWGLYGTSDWWENLEKENLIQCIEGEISKVYASGHNDFPEFEINTGVTKFSFQRLGNEKYYMVGQKIQVHYIKSKYILPISGLEETLKPLRIIILE